MVEGAGESAASFGGRLAALVIASALVVAIVAAPFPPALAFTLALAAAGSALYLWHRVREHAEASGRALVDHRIESEQYRRRFSALQQEAMQATTALSKMRDGVVMLAPDGKILLMNPAARRLLDLAGEQNYVSRPLTEVVRIPDISRAVSQAVTGDGPQAVKIEVAAGESVRPIHCQIDQIAPSPDASLLMTLRDETESHRVDQIRREFVANISHELKTPLAAIKGYAETVELAISDDPHAADYFIKQIHTQCQRLERLIADMMQLARAQSGKGNLNFGAVSMSEVVDESLKSYRPIAESKQIELIIDDLSAAQVYSDSEAALTIANNLIGNAIHYTPSGGQVRVSCRPEVDGWSLVVADNGVGIPEAEQERIFERFYRAGKNRGAGGGGSGIGLAMVKNLATTMGGHVRVSSKPGVGSTFEVVFPRADA